MSSKNEYNCSMCLFLLKLKGIYNFVISLRFIFSKKVSIFIEKQQTFLNIHCKNCHHFIRPKFFSAWFPIFDVKISSLRSFLANKYSVQIINFYCLIACLGQFYSQQDELEIFLLRRFLRFMLPIRIIDIFGTKIQE